MRNDELTRLETGEGEALPGRGLGARHLRRLGRARRRMVVGGACVALAVLAGSGATSVAAGASTPVGPEATTLTGQSPIDLRPDEVTFVESLPEIKFSYPTSVDVELVNTGSPDEEKTVRADVPAGAADLELDGEVWELDQFHWHTPSEHEIDGRATPMEMHLVHHRADGTASSGPFLVVAVLLEKGGLNRALQPIIRDLALVEEADETTTVPHVDLVALLPDGRESFRYSGSLTTPPFTEPVSWVVLAEPVNLSRHQIREFQQLFPHGNSREVQPLGDRVVLSDAANAFDGCGSRTGD